MKKLPTLAPKKIFPIRLSAVSIAALLLCTNLQAAEVTYSGLGTELKNAITGTVSGLAVYPGNPTSPEHMGNKVTINYDSTNASFTNPVNVFGGVGIGNHAQNNHVIFNNGKVERVYGGYSPANHAHSNAVTIAAGEIKYLYGGYSPQGNSYNNTVTLNGGSITDLYAGHTSNGEIYNNHIVMNNGKVLTRLWGGNASTGNIYGNQIEIIGGEIGGFIYGGWVLQNGDVSHNTITISGGTFTAASGFIRGGVISNTGDATHNTIVIDGTVDLSKYTVEGATSWGGGDVFTGNRFAIKARDVQIKTAQNFEFYDFYIPANAANGDSLLKAASSVDLSNSYVEVKGIAPGTPLMAGDSVVLIDAQTLNGTATTVNSSVTQGVSLIYDVEVEQNGNQVTATIASKTNIPVLTPPTDGSNNSFWLPARVNPQIKALSEGRIASLAFTTQGADLAAGQGIQSARNSTGDQKQITSFGVMSGSSNRYKSGSHVDADGFSLMAGAAYKNENLLVGGFIEGGWGSYDSYNSFTNAADVKGKGDSKYYGVGILGRYDFNNGVYLDGSLRIGKNDTDFKSHDLLSAAGVYASYDMKTTYYSAHIGAGYIWKLSDKTSLDFSGKYLWTHQDGGGVNVAGDPIHFSSADSHRARLQGNLNYAITDQVTFIAGLGYEHEFDADINATTYYLYKIDTPSLKGGTGIGELGFSVKPTAQKNLTLDFRLKGYAGKREGINGTVQLLYAF